MMYICVCVQSHVVVAVPTRFDREPSRSWLLGRDEAAEHVAAKIARKTGLPVYVTLALDSILGTVEEEDGGARAEAVRAQVAKTFLALIGEDGDVP